MLEERDEQLAAMLEVEQAAAVGVAASTGKGAGGAVGAAATGAASGGVQSRARQLQRQRDIDRGHVRGQHEATLYGVALGMLQGRLGASQQSKRRMGQVSHLCQSSLGHHSHINQYTQVPV
jgi:hypothetical protein